MCVCLSVSECACQRLILYLISLVFLYFFCVAPSQPVGLVVLIMRAVRVSPRSPYMMTRTANAQTKNSSDFKFILNLIQFALDLPLNF